jgi:hypothetical protein
MRSAPNDDISALVQSEVSRLSDPGRRAALAALLTPPRKFALDWDYGTTDEQFECWQVGQSTSGDLLLVYCAQGFGPAFPWGFVFPLSKSLGMDSQWHSGLADAAICAGLLDAPDDYESPGPRE